MYPNIVRETNNTKNNIALDSDFSNFKIEMKKLNLIDFEDNILDFFPSALFKTV